MGRAARARGGYTMSTPRVVVVGGGLAGIAAALRCADAGAAVTLLERRPWLGGATYSFRRDALWVDNGQHVFLRCCTAYRGLLERLGVAGHTTMQDRLDIPVLTPRHRHARLARNGLPAPFHLVSALARYRILAPRERLASALAARRLGRLDPDDPALDEVTFGEWLTANRQSRAAVEALWELITLPTLNVRADEASLALAAMVFRTGLLTRTDAADIGYAHIPLGALHGEAAQRELQNAGADVRCRARVTAIEPGHRAQRPIVALGAARVAADAVILAVPHDAAADLLPCAAVPHAPRLRLLDRSPIVNVHVVYDRPVTNLSFAAAVDTPVQWVFDRSEPSGLTSGQYLAVSLSAATEYLRVPSSRLRAEFIPALEALFPGARGARVTDFFVTREPAATFRQAAGHRAYRPGTRTGVPRLYLAGAWTDTGWPATMEGAVRSGLAAAEAALTDLDGVARRPEEAVA
jgi:squalene-associated FAD-dependent desaturase